MSCKINARTNAARRRGPFALLQATQARVAHGESRRGHSGATRHRCRLVERLEPRAYFAVGATPTFADHLDFDLGDAPAAMVSADFNGDGRADLAVLTAGFESSQMTVYLSNGDGTFTAGQTIAGSGGSDQAYLVEGDFNGDTRPDLAMAAAPIGPDAGQSTDITVYLGLGNGTFDGGHASAFLLQATQYTTGDFNGDGHLDIASTDGEAGGQAATQVNVLLGAGDGTFSSEKTTNVSAASALSGLTAADFTGDGVADVVVSGTTQYLTEQYQSLLLLRGNGDGTFTATGDPMTLALAPNPEDQIGQVSGRDLNGDGKPDLVGTATSHILSFVNNGDSTFSFLQDVPFAADGAEPIVLSDINADGSPDVVQPAGAGHGKYFSVYGGLGDGNFDSGTFFDTADGPAIVVAGDFNGDGLPDVATGNADADSVSVLLNTTPAQPSVRQSTTTVQALNNPAQNSDTLHFLVTVTSAAGNGATPTGDVFLGADGLNVGGGTLDPATGQVTVTATMLGVGDHSITVTYLGDANYDASTSAAITQTIDEQPLTPPATVTPSVQTVSLPPIAVPGDSGTVELSLKNNLAGSAKGLVSVNLFASTDTTLDDGDAPVAAPALAHVLISLVAGGTKDLLARFTLPSTIAAGSYYVLAKVTPISGLSASDVSDVAAASSSAIPTALDFGTVSGRRSPRLLRTLSSGAKIVFILNGPGTGSISDDGNGNVDLTLNGTTAASNVIIAALGGATGVIRNITTDSAISALIASRVALSGTAHIAGDVSRVITGDINSGGSLVLDGSTPATLVLGNVTDASIQSAAPLQLLSIHSWTDSDQTTDQLDTPWIGSFIDAGAFPAQMLLSGVGAPAGSALKVARIAGGVGPGLWSVGGSASVINIGGSAASGFSLAAAGSISLLSIGGNLDGDVAAATGLGVVSIRGSVAGARVFAGANFGADHRFGGGDDTFAAATITSIRAGGSVTNSVFAAGLDPINGIIDDGDDVLLSGGAIKTFSAGGVLGNDSRVLAAQLPTKALIAGALVTTTGDPRFSL
jgi:hypothetical protein